MKKSVILFFCVCLFACNQKVGGLKTIDASNKQLKSINGVLYFNDAPFNGLIKTFDEVNQTNNVAEYLDGKKNGEEKKFYLNDSIAEIRFYKKGLKVGVHKAWWENRLLKFELPFNNEGAYNGTVKEWYDNGQLVKEFNYQNGFESGSQKMWQFNGNIRANYTVINGERFGLIGLKKCYTVKINDEK